MCIWATSWQNQQSSMCAQRRLRSAWASAQSDQSLRCVLSGYLRTKTFFMRTAKTLIRLGRCPGWSESLLGAHSFCWFWHVVAHICMTCINRSGKTMPVHTDCSAKTLTFYAHANCFIHVPHTMWFWPGPVGCMSSTVAGSILRSSKTFFRGDWSRNHFYGHFSPYHCFKSGSCQ